MRLPRPKAPDDYPPPRNQMPVRMKDVLPRRLT